MENLGILFIGLLTGGWAIGCIIMLFKAYTSDDKEAKAYKSNSIWIVLGLIVTIAISSSCLSSSYEWLFGEDEYVYEYEQTDEQYNGGYNISFKGKHCNGILGCDCPGFKPKTDGDLWEESYCDHCGHKKSSHK